MTIFQNHFSKSGFFLTALVEIGGGDDVTVKKKALFANLADVIMLDSGITHHCGNPGFL